MKWMFLYATACCLPFGYSDLKAVGWAELGWADYAQIAYVVLGATFLAYLLMPIGQKNLRPTVASSYSTCSRWSPRWSPFRWEWIRSDGSKGVAVLLVFAGGVYRDDQQVEGAVGSRAGRGSASR